MATTEKTGRGHHLREDWLDDAARRVHRDEQHQGLHGGAGVIAVIVGMLAGVGLALLIIALVEAVRPQRPAPAPAASQPAAKPTATPAPACEQAKRGGCRVLLTAAGRADHG